MNLELSERQANTVAAAITILATGVVIATLAGVVWLLAWFLSYFSAVFLPLLLGALGALVFRPYFVWLCDRLRLPTPLALTVVFLSGLLPLVGFVWFFGALVFQQVLDLVSHAPGWWERGQEVFRERWPQVVEFFETSPIGRRLREALLGQQDSVMAGLGLVGEKALAAGAGVLRGVGALLSWAVLPVYFGFFLATRPRPVDSGQLLPFLKSDTRQDVVYLAKQFVSILVAFFRGQLIVAFLQGLLYAVGFSIVGLKYGFVIGLVLGFLNIIPYLGSIVGLGVALPLAFFQGGGGLGRVVAVLVVFTVVQLIESYLLTPKIMGDRTGLHFMAIIVAIFFWGTALGGIIGMILAIPLTAFLVSFWRLVRDKYITEIV